MKTNLKKLKKENYFFDVHLHVFNLSHAGLLAFINRFLLNKHLSFNLILNKKALILRILFELGKLLVSKKLWSSLGKLVLSIFKMKDKARKGGTAALVNTLSVLENDIARQFRFIELDYLMLNRDEQILNEMKRVRNTVFGEDANIREELKTLKQSWNNAKNKSVTINRKDYQRIIITPLMIDFGVKSYLGLPPDLIHYHVPPRKQIKEQAIDLFNGIHEYYRTSWFQLFEIYPFLAINTKNFEIEEDIPLEKRKYSMTLNKILDKYFADFNKDDSPEKRHDLLIGKLNNYINCKYSTEPVFKDPEAKDETRYFYAGIKVYPPLGFDPWPEKVEELRKVEVLYKYSSNKNIPITTHCSDAGFVAVGNSKELTQPDTWKKVLDHYPDLKLNFAHDGINAPNIVDNYWSDEIIKLILKFPNVYLDISYNSYNEKYYQDLHKFLLKTQQNLSTEETEKLSNHILFGTDFMVNLFDVESYTKYIQLFSETQVFNGSPFSKEKFCQQNSYDFIFGE